MKRSSLSLSLLLLVFSQQTVAQLVTEWVENRTQGANNEIELGYPVPQPVDTPLPFDGFRTYAGLHTRHLDLVATTPWVHQETVGLTRAGRTIWAYRLGDADTLTIDGLPEPATLTNGGIHAREWQGPEVVTGIMELFALHEDDDHFYDYLRDNMNMIVIPSLNIDGFLQTQRYPALSYMQIDPDYPDYYPRDGRMRRKNMLNTDEDFYTTVDLLNGVDLNRNNAPYWATVPSRSSSNPESLVYHGSEAASEPETQALETAAQLGPANRLRIYTDVHSYSQVQLWGSNGNQDLAYLTERVLRVFARHHSAFPAGKYYYFDSRNVVPVNQGIGSTDDYFAFNYQVPSWTLEIEPSGGQAFHYPMPGAGADYGGSAENSHDGFILPDSEIRRVREELAQSFAAVYYQQAGPPAIQSMRVLDPNSQAVVFEADWDLVDNQTRTLYSNQLRPLQLGKDYDLWVAFNKPMRWRENGVVVPFPGQASIILNVYFGALVGESDLTSTIGEASWLDQPGPAPDGYVNYEDDAFRSNINLAADAQNLGLVSGSTETVLKLLTYDMTGSRTDGNPGTIVDWQDGSWSRYEDANGDESVSGGYDSTLSLQVTNEDVPPPFVLEPGTTASWYDPAHDGEGFLIELLPDDRAVMYWFTYDGDGNQDWYVASGRVIGNRIEFTRLKRVSGGEFGPGFDPQNVTREVVGSASFIWSGCDEGSMSYQIGTRHGRMDLVRLTRVLGVECGEPRPEPLPETALLSGSWYDPSHDGEGYLVELIGNDRVVVYWFSFDPDGNRRWFYDAGKVTDGKLVFDGMLTTSGGIFGPDFDPLAVERLPWGSLELDIECSSGTATYNATEEGFGSGVLNLVRLTSIDQLDCP
ncbi:MAG: M14 family zinc carboxypeptidase [Xanthomonadales bacterium]|nr:M14 family zinc carboxypeptidase [Xanthomonadales bacterium]